jgi:putative transposase
MNCDLEVQIPNTLPRGLGDLLTQPGSAGEQDAVRFRVYPTRIQAQALKRWIGTQRYLYNRKVEELEYQLWLKKYAKFSNRYEAPQEDFCAWDQAFSKYKNGAPWMEEIPSFVRRNGCSRFKAAMSKWGKGGGKPQFKTRNSTQSVLLTAECFGFRTIEHADGTREDCLWIGTKSKSYGVLKWVAHCQYKEPRQISITQEPDGKWFVGFGFQTGKLLPKCEIPQTKEQVLGVDRGVVNPASDNTGRFYDLTLEEEVKLERREKKRTQLQIKLTRQKKGSKRRAKTKKAIAGSHGKDRRLRASVAHRIANHVIKQALGTGCKAIGLEALQLDNMTRRAKAKLDGDGSYLPNAQSAKSGLNKSMLGRGLGRIKTFVEYRCQRAGLVFVEVDPCHTSTQCPACHHRDKANRVTQEDFQCTSCGYKEHADVVGSINVRNRAFQKITDISPGTSLKNARPNARKKSTPGRVAT